MLWGSVFLWAVFQDATETSLLKHFSFINTEIHKTGIHETPFLLMIDLTHIIDFATQLPHPSDLGLVKPSGGFQLLPAIFGVIAIVQVSQFHWYARKGNDPSERFTR